MSTKPNATAAAQQMHAVLERLRAAIDDPNARYNAVEDIAAQIADEAARLAGGEYRPEYNGWSNRETWNTALWINNDQSSDEAAREIVTEHMAAVPEHWRDEPTPYAPDIARAVRNGQINAAADALKEWWDEANAPDDSDALAAGPISDAWSYALAVTDWYRIAEGLAEE